MTNQSDVKAKTSFSEFVAIMLPWDVGALGFVAAILFWRAHKRRLNSEQREHS